MQMKTIAMILLIAIATVGAIGIACETQAFATVPPSCTRNPHGEFGINPTTGNPHNGFNPTGNPHIGGFGTPCPGE